MSNVLTVTLMEFKPVNSDEKLCGIFAIDDYAIYAYRASESWEGFKKEFPSVESIMTHLSGQNEFQELSESYVIVDGKVQMSENEFSVYSHIEIDGADYVYD